jgi:hypothetical protein
MDRKEWGELPWWESLTLIEGLQDEGILGGKEDRPAPTEAAMSGHPGMVTDLSRSGSPPPGFKTRRAG